MKYKIGDSVCIDMGRLLEIDDGLSDYRDDIGNKDADIIYGAVYSGKQFIVNEIDEKDGYGLMYQEIAIPFLIKESMLI